MALNRPGWARTEPLAVELPAVGPASGEAERAYRRAVLLPLSLIPFSFVWRILIGTGNDRAERQHGPRPSAPPVSTKVCTSTSRSSASPPPGHVQCSHLSTALYVYVAFISTEHEQSAEQGDVAHR
jgi:hypothetical protein